MKFSILTATYNRAKYLPKLYKSIVDNIDEDYEIEWLIMDDGSTDDTEKVCKSFVNEKNLVVKYYKQENQGKMQAINNLAKYVSGELWIECDSDDYFVKNALKIIAKKSTMLQENKNLYALVFLKNENTSKLSGNKFPFEDKETTMFDLYFKHGVIGEKIIVFNSEIRKKYQYIIEPGEKFCTEARMYHQIDLKYNVRCYNQVVIEGEYQSDGYTKNIKKIFLESPKGHYEYFKEIFEHDMKGVSIKKRAYAIKHLILFSNIVNRNIDINNIKGNLNKFIILLAWFPGKIKSKKYIKEFEYEK